MANEALTLLRVIEEAEALADTVGLLQMRLAEVAERLGVKVPSLYKYVGGVAELQHHISVRAKNDLASAIESAIAGKGAHDALYALSFAYRAWAAEHPGRYSASVWMPDVNDAEDVAASNRAMRTAAPVMEHFALYGDDAVDATRALRSALHGFVSLEAVNGFGTNFSIDRSFNRLVAGVEGLLSTWPSTPAAPLKVAADAASAVAATTA